MIWGRTSQQPPNPAPKEPGKARKSSSFAMTHVYDDTVCVAILAVTDNGKSGESRCRI